MKKSRKDLLDELNAKIHILEQENEFLSVRVEEHYLLNKAFEEIFKEDNADDLLFNTLERSCILFDIPFSGLFRLGNGKFTYINGYSLFSNDTSVKPSLDISKKSFEQLKVKSWLSLKNKAHNYTFKFGVNDFQSTYALLIPLNTVVIPDRYFCFLVTRPAPLSEEHILVLDRTIEVVATKLEKTYYENGLKKLNHELEERIALSTRQLTESNAKLKIVADKFQVLTESMKDVVWVLDTDTNYFTYISPSVTRLRGYTPEELISKPSHFLLSPEEKRNRNAMIVRRAEDFRSGKADPFHFYTDDSRQICKDGS